MGDLIQRQEPEPRKLPPIISGHSAQQAELSVYHFIMAQGQDKPLRETIGHGERQLVVVIRAEREICLAIFQGVVHPAHVPLIVEPKAAGRSISGHMGPGRAFLRHGNGPGRKGMDCIVELPEELHRSGVFLAALVIICFFRPIRQPKVQVQHTGHAVHPNSVRVVAAQPIQRRAD